MKLDGTSKCILVCIPVISAVGCIIGAFIVSDSTAFFAGTGIGAAGSALRVLLLEKAFAGPLSVKPKSASGYLRLFKFIGLCITIVALGLPLLLGDAGLYGSLVGTSAMPLAALIADRLTAKPDHTKQNQPS